MKIVIKPCGGGKTYDLIRMADGVPGGYIVCRDREEAYRIQDMAKEMGCDINFPITIDELKNRKGHLTQNHKLFFDDLRALLHRFVIGTPQIPAVSINGTDEDIIT